MTNKIGNIFKGDKVVWMVFMLLCLISLVEVFSASSSLSYKTGNYMKPMLFHGFMLLLGLVAVVATSSVNCRYYKVALIVLYPLSVFLLFLVLVTGESTNGASRWISLGPFTFQPSELAKGTMILAEAQILSAMQTGNGASKNALKSIAIVAAFLLLPIMLENLSTAVLLGAVIIMMMFIGRIPMRQLGYIMSGIAALVVIMLLFIFVFGNSDRAQMNETQQNVLTETVDDAEEAPKKVSKIDKLFHRAYTWKGRIVDFASSEELDPDSVDLRGKGAQSNNAKIAIASSGVTGKGPGHSTGRDFLSQAFSDFIYAIIIEETGIIGAFVVVMLYVILLFRAARIANKCENHFPAFLVMGLALLLVTQALFNMCVAVGFAPVTGQPLPLISKGGTSTLINCVYIGVIIGVSRSAKKRQDAITN